MRGALLGPKYEREDIRSFLDSKKVKYTYYPDEQELLRVTAEAVADGRVVGWFQGRMEFGPRALGARSIIGDARSEAMQSTMNLRIKFRESFRPFAPAILREDVGEYFELDGDSPYMLMVAPVQSDKRCRLSKDQLAHMKHPDLRKRVNVKRSVIPAVTHVDMSARIQTVDERRHGRFWRLMKEFKRQTGSGVMINTSFNVRGEPIVCTPADAYRCFLASEMDVLVLGDFVLRRTEQEGLSDEARQKYLDSFRLD